MGMDELSSLLVYALPMAFSYTVPVVIWPLLCFYKFIRRENVIISNILPLFLAIAFWLMTLVTMFVSMEWYFAEIDCFEIRMLILLIALPVYGLCVNRKAVDYCDLGKRAISFAITMAGCLAILFFASERQITEKCFIYVLLFEVVTFTGQWIYLHNLRSRKR